MDKEKSKFTDLSIKKIQRFYRKRMVLRSTSEFLKLNLSNYSKDFNLFSKFIKKPLVLNFENNIIKSLKNYKKQFKLENKVLITSYLILNFKEEIFGKKLDSYDLNIYNWSKEVVEQVEDLNNSLMIDKLWLLLNNFQIIFKEWKEKDKSKLLEGIITSYYNRCEHIKEIKESSKILDEEKVLLISKLNILKKDLTNQMKLIDPNFNIQFFEKNYEAIYNKIKIGYNEISVNIINTMKKAYYDMLTLDLEQKNLLSIIELIKDINIRLLLLIPSKEKIEKKLDINKIIEYMLEYTWSDNLKQYIKFIANTVIILGAPCDDNENKIWYSSLDKKMENNFEKNLPMILISIEEKLERIFELINNLKK